MRRLSDKVHHVYHDRDHSTSSHDFLLSRPTMVLIILVRKLKCVTSTRRVHKHCKATPSKPDLATKLDMSMLRETSSEFTVYLLIHCQDI